MSVDFSMRQFSQLTATDLSDSSLIKTTGGQVEHIRYTPFGYRTKIARTHIGFTGHLEEPRPSAYLLGNGHRLFLTPLMRFTSPDGLSPFMEGGYNSYAYCKAEPIDQVDDSGRFPIFKIFKKTPKVTINILHIEKTSTKVFRHVPNPYRSASARISHYTSTEKVQKVKPGTQIIYKGRSITDRSEAIKKLEKALNYNKSTMRSAYDEYNINVIHDNSVPILEKLIKLRQKSLPANARLPSYQQAMNPPSYDEAVELIYSRFAKR